MASKLLDTKEYGFYIFLFALGSAGGLIFSGGLPLILIKYFRGEETQEHAANKSLLKRLAHWQCRWLFLAAVFCGAIALFNPAFVEGRPWVALPLFLFVASFAIGEFLINYFRIQKSVFWALMPRENIWRSLSALILLAILISGHPIDGGLVFTLVSGCLVLCIAVQSIAFFKWEGLGWLRGRPKQEDAAHITRSEASFFSANVLFNSMASYLETLIIGLVIGLEEAAFFFVALRLTQLLLLPVSAMDTIGVPMVSRKFQDKDISGAQHLVGIFSAASFGLSVIGGMGLIVFGPFILGLFKPEFLDQFHIVILMSVGAIIHAWFGTSSNLMMIADGERYYLWTRCVLIAFALVGFLVLGPLYGLAGIVGTSLVIGTTEHIVVWLWTRKNLQVDVMASAFFKPLLPTGRSS